jgi:hypothetical protein
MEKIFSSFACDAITALLSPYWGDRNLDTHVPPLRGSTKIHHHTVG